MKNLVWFLLGVAGGFVAAHVINKIRAATRSSPRSTRASRSSPTASATRTASRRPAIVGTWSMSRQDRRRREAVDAAKDAASDAVDAAADA